MSLKKSIITFNSITYAIKARKLLSREDVSSKLIKLDPTRDDDGCKYGLEISIEKLFTAISLLRNADFDYKVRDGNDIP